MVVRVVGVGVDTLHLTMNGGRTPAMLRLLDPRNELRSAVELGGRLWEPSRLAGGGVLLASEGRRLLVRGFGQQQGRPLKIELGSAPLWSLGLEGAIESVTPAVGELLRERTEHVSRVDLAVDVEGAAFGSPTDGRWTTWAAVDSTTERPEAEGEPERLDPRDRCLVRTYATSGRIRYRRFGSGDLQVRVYDKTHAVAHGPREQRKTWLYDLWSQRGWQGSDVWRVEAQVRGKKPRSWGLKPSTLAGQLGAVWRKAVGGEGERRGWLLLRTPSKRDTNRARWPVDPDWRTVQAADWSDAGRRLAEPLVREAEREASWEELMRGLRGYLVSLGAIRGEADLGRLLALVREDVELSDQAQGRSFVLDVQKRAATWNMAAPAPPVREGAGSFAERMWRDGALRRAFGAR